MTIGRRALLATVSLAAAGVAAACGEATRPDTTAPQVVIRSPAPDTVVASASLALTLVLTDDERVVSASVQVGDGAEQPVSITPGETVEVTMVVQLAPGENRVVVHALDGAGNRGSAELRAARDIAFPSVRLTSPRRDTTVTGGTVTFRGTFSDDLGVVAAGYQVGTNPAQPISITPGKEVPFQVTVGLVGSDPSVYIFVIDRVGKTGGAGLRVTQAPGSAAIAGEEATTCAPDAAGAAFCQGYRSSPP